MGRLFIMFISYLCMMIFSVSATIFPFNGHTTTSVADSYTILAFPSKYVFYVVALIYISILYWFYKQWQLVRKQNMTFTFAQTALFTIGMLFQMAWIYYWFDESFIISCVLIVLSALCITAFYLLMPTKNTWAARIPISLFLSWLMIVVMLNIAIILVYYRWDGFGLSQSLWSVILLTGFVAIVMHIRFHHYDPYFPLLFIWVYVGIAVHNNFEELLVTTAALFLSGVFVTGIIFMRKKEKTT